VDTNRFGYRMGSGAQILSESVDAMPRTADEIAQRAGHPRGAVREHLEDMHAKGFVSKSTDDNSARYWLNEAYRPTTEAPDASN
jgi:predicted ArsR family transcriptional regulator